MLRRKVKTCVAPVFGVVLTFLKSKHCGSPPSAIQHGKHWWEQPPGIMENSHKLNQQILQLWSCNHKF